MKPSDALTHLAVCSLGLLLGCAAVASAANRTLELTIEAGQFDRQQTPVSVRLSLPVELAEVQRAAVLLDDGRVLVGQLAAPRLLAGPTKSADGSVARELHLVLPKLAAGGKTGATVRIDTNQPAAKPSFAWQDTTGEYAELSLLGGQAARPVLRYMYKALDDTSKESREQTYKVFHHLYDPAGKQLVTKGAGGRYTHHRGLFYGFNRISYADGQKKADTWHCSGDAHLSHQEFLASEAGPVLGRHRLKIDWHGPGKQVFAQEEREMTVYHRPGGQLVEFASRLRPTVGPVTLDGDPQHAGFQFRAAQEVAAKTSGQTYYLRPSSGKGEPGKTLNWPQAGEHVNLPYNAMSFVLGDQRFTAAYLDRPENPKEARFSERDYGRFGSYFKYELTADKPLELNYRVWLQAGETTQAEIAALVHDFVEPPKVTVAKP